VAQRLARRKAYEALGALGASLQRSAAEPQRARPPVDELSAFLDGGQRLMAHLSAVRLMLVRRSAVLENPGAAAALRAARAELASALAGPGAADPPPRRQGLAGLPLQPPERDLLPWLERRLAVAADEAHEVRGEAQRLLDRITDREPERKDSSR
jgi:hypothetical protein